jgi:Helix-turn-helix domain/RodZ C-terminal domain
VFEIGNSLREARLRQGYELPRVEADTKIRAKYLRALEEERFEVLPGETYVKGFLRTYAEYLGLDGQLYVDEFNSRFTREEEPLAPPRPRRQASRSRAVESNFVIVALAGIIAVTILVVVAWKFGSSGAEPPSGLPVGSSSTESTGSTTERSHAKPPAKPNKTKLVLSADGGDSWLRVRSHSATGKLLYEGTLQAGQTQRFVDDKRIWLQVGAPAYLKGTVNGKRIKNMPDGPAIVVVKADGLQVVSTA